MGMAAAFQEVRNNPIDVIEAVAGTRDWMVERPADEEINLVVAGSWCDLQVSLNWNEHMEGLHLACSFDLKVPARLIDEVTKVVSIINEQMFFGHFDLWRNEGLLMFRHSILLAGGASINADQCDGMLRIALESAERYYPVFQFVIWAGKTASEAMQASMLETQGEA
ncbi:MAG TPA: hypothetical protein ENJ55_05735 [Rhizobiales bacterium]|nr:hypothetical protein [Hyphomicrobiales bacterium]